MTSTDIFLFPGASPHGPPTRSLAGPLRPTPFARLTRYRSFAIVLVRGVRHERDLSRTLDRVLQRALMRRADARNATGLNLAALGDERRQHLHVLVGDVVDLLHTELADATAPEECAASALLLVA